jgi:hypothetical protein
MIEKIIHRITSAGAGGIKKAELKKKFGAKCDAILQNLLDKGDIFVEKKGNAYCVWTKDNYILHLSKNDPKVKLVLNTVNRIKDIDKTNEHIDNLDQPIVNTPLQNFDLSNHTFKIEFDKCLSESSTSIGWAPFSQIRKKICESQKLSAERFYTLVTDLVERNRENYELSSGGDEGIVMRGLIHGFVRNV